MKAGGCLRHSHLYMATPMSEAAPLPRLGDAVWSLFGNLCLRRLACPPHHLSSPSPAAPVASGAGVLTLALYLPSLRIGEKNNNVYLVVGRFPAELGTETRSNGSGTKNGSERTQKLAPETNSKAVS